MNEVREMARMERLPLTRSGVRVHYEGSIDKAGANADWDWALYQDNKGGGAQLCAYAFRRVL